MYLLEEGLLHFSMLHVVAFYYFIYILLEFDSAKTRLIWKSKSRRHSLVAERRRMLSAISSHPEIVEQEILEFPLVGGQAVLQKGTTVHTCNTSLRLIRVTETLTYMYACIDGEDHHY